MSMMRFSDSSLKIVANFIDIGYQATNHPLTSSNLNSDHQQLSWKTDRDNTSL